MENTNSMDGGPSSKPSVTLNTQTTTSCEWGVWKDPSKKANIWCTLCDKKVCGGITRLKQHLTHTGGQVSGCPNVSNDIKKRVVASMQEKYKLKKEKKRKLEILQQYSVGPGEDDDEGQEEDEIKVIEGGQPQSEKASRGLKRKTASNVCGSLDTMFKPNYDKLKQSTLDRNNPIKEKLKMAAWKEFANWAYSIGLPFNAVHDENFQRFINAVGEYGKGMPAPSYHNIRVTLLKDVLEDTNKFVDSFRSHWKRSKCTIMSDFRMDEKGRSLINFFVNCPHGTIFLKSIDASEHVKDAQLIVKMINEVIEDVGEENIVQVVTNNGPNFKAAGKIIEEQHPQMFWTPCAAHCVNLMIGDIGEKVPNIKSVLTDARAIVVYIYNHGRILNMMRRLMKNRELHRSCVTRFATQFYTIQSIHENRHHLQVLFVSEQWRKSDFAKKAIGKRIERIIAKQEFWDNIFLACQVLAPLVDVVCLVDTKEKLCMGYIYDAMERAKDQIKKNLTGTAYEGLITKVWSMIQTRWSDQLHHPLHAAGYFLNPSIYYVQELEGDKNRYIKTGLYEAIDRFVRDEEKNDTLRLELDKYIDSEGQFGSAAAIRNRAKVAPHVWWCSYGIDTPLLQEFAIGVLSQTCSASPCERNWSAFDHLHSKKRNCLLQKKLNDLVFIQYNKRLERRYKSLKDNKSSNPIFLREAEENDDWVVPTNAELQEFLDARDGLLWSDVREAMRGIPVGLSTRSKRERYRDDSDDEDIVHEAEANVDEEVTILDDVDSDAEPVACN